MRDHEFLRHRIVRALAVSGLLGACTPEAPKTEDAPKEKTKEEGRVEPVGVRTNLDPEPEPDPDPEPEPEPDGPDRGCGDPNPWCGPKAAVHKIIERKLPASLGCPASVAGAKLTGHASEPEYAGLSENWPAHVDELATGKKRAEGDEDTCCYLWEPPCKGRPLRDGDNLVLADATPGSHWLADDTPDLDDARLPAPGRQLVARMWLDDALAEHASIASFARVVLELLAVGAPAALVAAATRAVADEVEHARLCFAIASAFAGRSVGPTALPALPPRAADLVRLAVDTFIEGCIEETAAALEAERAAASCTSASIRAALQRIARDEADHAALAWRTVAWAVAQGGDAVKQALRELAIGSPSIDPTIANAELLHRAGRLTPHEQTLARRDALREIVAPMLAQLVGSA